MEENRNQVTEKILDITLEIISLLTGEDHMVVKKSGERAVSSTCLRVSEGSSRIRSSSSVSAPRFPLRERHNEQKILALTNAIIQLLTGEVQDVALCHSMEEWEYLDGHKELYKDPVMEDHSSLSSVGEAVPEGFHTRLVLHQNRETTDKTIKKPRDRGKSPKMKKPHGRLAHPVSPTCRGGNLTDLDLYTQTQSPSTPLKEEPDSVEDDYITDISAHTDQTQTRHESTDVKEDPDAEQTEIEYISVHIKEESNSWDDGDLTNTYSSPNYPLLHTVEDEAACEGNLPDGDIHNTINSHRTTSNLSLSDPETNRNCKSPLDAHDTEPMFNCSELVKHRTFHTENTTVPSETRKVMFSEWDFDTEETTQPFSFSEYGEEFNEKMNLIMHQKTRAGVNPFQCDECGKCYSQAKRLALHKKIHTEEKTFKCDECGKYFTEKYLLIHQRTHTGEKPFKCDECGKGFIRAANLTAHKKIHTGEKPYKCEECGKCFTQPSILALHRKSHTEEKPFKCDECGKYFTEKYLLVHQRTHTGEKPFKCDECGKCFSTASNLTAHKKIHTGEKPHKCDVCGKCFIKATNLIEHRRIHTGEKPFECDECGKCFPRSIRLALHKRIHAEEKPFECSECGKCFTQNYELIAHQRIHTGEKPFKCDECGKCFSTTSNLKVHRRIHSREKTT